ncbi:hypothetical protein KY495_08640 [Massilia sp. PAMC28688]|uniref:DUF6279 family lipoprotein n=1 Tax=Massilia sp. PAMC28688 TaxID=2861283 RepID=UPI001C6276B2|nr:DUF6279 family lipoprotein [Massilia sp. PAMC28688]QYF95204.1 hypothetical protein KY495_08640 [Massilia sp. PAMC28688]
MKKFNTQDHFLQRFRVLCLLLVMAAVAACSSVRFAYNQGDTLLYWWVDAYVDLDSEQGGMVKQDIDQLINWHRKTQLRDYGQLLAQAQAKLGNGNVSHADLRGLYKDVLARTEVLAFKALPELTDLALSVKPDQIANIEEKFRKNNETYRKKFIAIDTDKKQKQRYKKSMEQLNLWFGDFSREQEAILRKASDARPLNNQFWLEERIIRQKKIIAVLREIQQKKLGREATSALLNNLLKDIFGRFDSPERKPFFDTYIDASINLMLTAIKIATPAQKAHAQQRMQGWMEDFKVLAADRK